MAAQSLAEPAAAIGEQLLIQRGEAGGPRNRHQEVPPDIADQPLDLALVIALARPAEAVGEQVMRLQLAEHPGSLPCPIPQNPSHRQGRVVIQNRARHLAKEAKRSAVPRAERLRGLRRIGLHEAGVAVRQVHGEEVDLLLHPADHRHGFAEVGLRMPGIVSQRYEHLPQPLAARQHVVLHDGDTAAIAMLVAQPLEDPLRGVPLLRPPVLIRLPDPVGEAEELIPPRPYRRLAPPVTGPHRERQHLRHRPRVYAKPSCRLPLADPLNEHCSPNLCIQLHALHPPALCPLGQRTIHCRILTPAQPDYPAASTLRDFGSGAYTTTTLSWIVLIEVLWQLL